MKTMDYIEEIKRAKGFTSDYQVARALGVARQVINKYRQRGRTFDDYTALRVAELLGIDPLQVIADANLQRAKDDEEREAWRKVRLRRFGPDVLAAFLITAGLSVVYDASAVDHLSYYANHSLGRAVVAIDR